MKTFYQHVFVEKEKKRKLDLFFAEVIFMLAEKYYVNKKLLL